MSGAGGAEGGDGGDTDRQDSPYSETASGEPYAEDGGPYAEDGGPYPPGGAGGRDGEGAQYGEDGAEAPVDLRADHAGPYGDGNVPASPEAAAGLPVLPSPVDAPIVAALVGMFNELVTLFEGRPPAGSDEWFSGTDTYTEKWDQLRQQRDAVEAAEGAAPEGDATEAWNALLVAVHTLDAGSKRRRGRSDGG